jgi:putative tricarboxylic transport membrane protein
MPAPGIILETRVKRRRSQLLTDKIIFAATLVLAAVYFYATSQIPSLEIGDPLGPKAFPRLLGIGLLITAGILLMEILRARKNPPVVDPATPAEEPPHWPLLGGVVVWTAAYFSIFTTLGFILSTTIYLLGMTAYFNRGRWTMNILTSVLFSAGSYIMFTKLLGVTLAQGVLPF